MATLKDLVKDFPELVRDSHLEATLRPNKYVPTATTHLTYSGARRVREKWVRQRELGRGGFGTVLLERRDPESRTDYNLRAVKMLDMTKISPEDFDYVRELEALAKFSQEKYASFFLKSYGWFFDDPNVANPGALFIAMEYCEAGDLKTYLEKLHREGGGLSEGEVQDIAGQLLQGLLFMHENDFAHRDLKPANILIKSKTPEDKWHVKICDLGLTKRIGTENGSTTVRGTSGFIAPEAIAGIGENPRNINPLPADMWCFGETVFYMLTHQQTFENYLQLYFYYQGRKDSPFPTGVLKNSGASDAAVRFIQQLMVARPDGRLTAEQAALHPWMFTADEPSPVASPAVEEFTFKQQDPLEAEEEYGTFTQTVTLSGREGTALSYDPRHQPRTIPDPSRGATISYGHQHQLRMISDPSSLPPHFQSDPSSWVQPRRSNPPSTAPSRAPIQPPSPPTAPPSPLLFDSSFDPGDQSPARVREALPYPTSAASQSSETAVRRPFTPVTTNPSHESSSQSRRRGGNQFMAPAPLTTGPSHRSSYGNQFMPPMPLTIDPSRGSSTQSRDGPRQRSRPTRPIPVVEDAEEPQPRKTKVSRWRRYLGLGSDRRDSDSPEREDSDGGWGPYIENNLTDFERDHFSM